MPNALLINSLEFAKQSLEIHDKILASNFPRLRDLLFSGQGEIEFRLAGGSDSRGRLVLNLVAGGTLEMACQRCLGRLDYPLAINRRYELVADESVLPESDIEDDEVDYLVADPKLDVLALVEEEILLALPLSVRHENDCTGGSVGQGVQKQNPFSVLEGLKTSSKN